MCCCYSVSYKLIRHAEEQTGIVTQKFRVREQTVRGWMKGKEILSQRSVGQAREFQCHGQFIGFVIYNLKEAFPLPGNK
jgi:hypothetical protein